LQWGKANVEIKMHGENRKVSQPIMSTEELGGKGARPSRQSVPYCETAKQLLDTFGQTVQQVLILHEQQFLAIVEGDLGANRFDLLIHEALEQKQNAKYAYLSHLDLHGCSS
jgi:hypothetical protein